MTKVLIAGTFDIIHPGHINFIKQAKELGNFLVVIIARDQNVKKMKGQVPHFNEEERLNKLDQLGLADKVVLGDLNDPYKVIKEEKPNVVALGYDQQSYVKGLHDLVINSNLSFKIEKLKPFKENCCKGKSVRKAVKDKIAGFLLINKPEDWTSHDVIAKLRSIISIKQIGHTGTLDPFATGLLICAVSGATKLIGMFDVLPKTYEATIKLRVVSDTYDRTGKVSSFKLPLGKLGAYRQDTKKSQISNTKLQTVLKSFIGKQQQVPPMFSAKKIAGKKLYELARKGQEVERKASGIEIYDIEVLKPITHNPLPTFNIRVTCSTGTYIRALAHNIGQKLGTGAILEELKRTAIGDFHINDAVQLQELNKDNYSEYLIRPLEALGMVTKHRLNRPV